MVGTAFRMDGGKREGRVNEFGGDGEALDAPAEVDFSRLIVPIAIVELQPNVRVAPAWRKWPKRVPLVPRS